MDEVNGREGNDVAGDDGFEGEVLREEEENLTDDDDDELEMRAGAASLRVCGRRTLVAVVSILDGVLVHNLVESRVHSSLICDQ